MSQVNAQVSERQPGPADSVAQRTAAQVELNYQAFRSLRPALVADHLNEYALMKDGAIVELFATAMGAYKAGMERFGPGNFSMQKIIDRPVDLGYFSHVMH